MTITLTGANEHQCRLELADLISVFVAEYDDVAIERHDGDESTVERMRESIQSIPFLSAKKMVMLRQPGKQKNFAEAIDDILNDVPDTTDLVIYEPKIDKRTSYYKTLKKKTDFREFGELDPISLAKWAVDYAKEKGGSLGFAEAKLLVDRAGANQQMLQNELDKLLAYGEQITRQNIELLVEKLPQSTVFELLDAVFSGNAKKAFELYKEQRALKVDPQAIIAMLAWQLNILAVIKTAGNLGPDQIAKEAKLSPFVVRKSQKLVSKLALSDIKRLVADLLALDISLKRSSLDADEALQLYLLKLAHD